VHKERQWVEMGAAAVLLDGAAGTYAKLCSMPSGCRSPTHPCQRPKLRLAVVAKLLQRAAEPPTCLGTTTKRSSGVTSCSVLAVSRTTMPCKPR